MSFDAKAKGSSTRSSKSHSPAVSFEALEVRSMMAAQPIQNPVNVDQSVALKPVARVAMVRAAVAQAAPELRIRALAPDQVRLNWTAVEGATSYRIERFVGRSQDWQVVATTDKTSITGSGLRGNRLYRYHVVAVSTEGTASVSEITSIRPNDALAHAAMRAEKIANMVETFRQEQTDLEVQGRRSNVFQRTARLGMTQSRPLGRFHTCLGDHPQVSAGYPVAGIPSIVKLPGRSA